MFAHHLYVYGTAVCSVLIWNASFLFTDFLSFANAIYLIQLPTKCMPFASDWHCIYAVLHAEQSAHWCLYD